MKDRGMGLDGVEAGDLFEMFHRVDNEQTRRIPGTGIGLHVAKRIVEAHGGEISLSTREGGGAVARVRIPVGVDSIDPT